GPAMRPPALAGYEVFQAVAVDVHAVHGMRFGQEIAEQHLALEDRLGLVAALQVGPDAELVRRAADDVGPAITVDVVGEHVGAGLSKGEILFLAIDEANRVELPGFVLDRGRLLPPAAGANDIELAVAVEIADAQAVRESLRAGDFMALRA